MFDRLSWTNAQFPPQTSAYRHAHRIQGLRHVVDIQALPRHRRGLFASPRVYRVGVTHHLGTDHPASIAGEEITHRMNQTVHIVITLAGRLGTLARLLDEYVWSHVQNR